MNAREDPEERIRELERSMSDAARRSELGAANLGGYDPRSAPGVPHGAFAPYGAPFPPGPGTAAGFPMLRLMLVMVIVPLVAVVAVVAFLVVRHSSGGSTRGGFSIGGLTSSTTASSSASSSRPSTTRSSTTTTSAATTTSGATSQSVQTLYHRLPRGYDSNNCSPVPSPNSHALATVQCDQTSDPRSPTFAAFSLFPDAASLADAFQGGTEEDTILQCPNGTRPPTTWHSKAAPNVAAGSLFCGNYSDQADLFWTKDSDLVLGDIQGPDLGALYQFFVTL